VTGSSQDCETRLGAKERRELALLANIATLCFDMPTLYDVDTVLNPVNHTLSIAIILMVDGDICDVSLRQESPAIYNHSESLNRTLADWNGKPFESCKPPSIAWACKTLLY
jgi:hypothetical protein